MKELFAMVLVLVGAILFLQLSLSSVERAGRERQSVSITSIVRAARESGFGSGIVSFSDDVCLDTLLPVEFPCEDREGLFADDVYCFEADRFYEVNATASPAGGICISVAEVG